jgi:hypothetical protein
MTKAYITEEHYDCEVALLTILDRRKYEYMFERNRSECKHVESFSRHIGSTGGPSRGTVFVAGKKAEFRGVPNTASKNTNTNIFSERSTGFKATIGLNKRTCS